MHTFKILLANGFPFVLIFAIDAALRFLSCFLDLVCSLLYGSSAELNRSALLWPPSLEADSGEIKATGLNAEADELYDKLEEDKVYYISKARMNLSKRKFSSAQEYELSLERNTEIEKVGIHRLFGVPVLISF